MKNVVSTERLPIKLWLDDIEPGAYKNIDKVMDNQFDLVKIIHELKPLAVIKG